MKEQSEIQCHVETTIAVVGGKWKPWILWHLYDGVRRYGELKRLTPGITGKMLTQQLRELEHDGIVERTVHVQKVPKVEYAFTAYGETLRPVLRELCNWGAKHGNQPKAARPRTNEANKIPPPLKPRLKTAVKKPKS